ncbi:MAG: HD domain-containing phosphohydrolase [Longimicrobiales bacterium]
MRLEFRTLRTRVGRRMFALFMLCALLPTTVLAVMGSRHVTNQLTEQGQRRIEQMGRAASLATMDALLEADRKVLTLTREWEENRRETVSSRMSEGWLLGAVVTEADGARTRLLGADLTPDALSAEDRDRLRRGEPVLRLKDQNGSVEVLLARSTRAQDADAPILWASLHTDSITDRAGLYTETPGSAGLCVRGPNGERIRCEGPAASEDALEALGVRTAHRGLFDWKEESGDRYLGSYSVLFLEAGLGAPSWTMIVGEAERSVLGSAAAFKDGFVFAIGLTLTLIVLLSVAQIRRNLVPLEKLQTAAGALSVDRFDAVVDIQSGDEFEDLGTTFNRMAGRIGRQVTALQAMSEIDRAVLSSLDLDDVLEGLLTSANQVLGGQRLIVAILDERNSSSGTSHSRGEAGTSMTEVFEMSLEMFAQLGGTDGPVWIASGDPPPAFLYSVDPAASLHYAIYPVATAAGLLGAIAVGYADPAEGEGDRAGHGRHLAGQVAIALSNSWLVRDLDELSWGALQALGKAVDSMSPWTAGHSERVATLAMEIGLEMGLASKEIDVLHRGGLLHDVGKIGVPSSVLEKPGRLTAEEFDAMRTHPVLGAEILSLVPRFKELVPLARSHHEWINGAGYPDGLTGDQIDPYAKILAVADVFDAISSDRPYRAAMPLEKALGIIRAGSGTQFEPDIVDAFMACRGVAVPEKVGAPV